MNVNSLCKLGIAQLRRQIRAAANIGWGLAKYRRTLVIFGICNSIVHLFGA